MRKILLFLVFVCVMHPVTLAQSGFFNENEHYYEYTGMNGSNIWPVKVDSVNFSNGDSTLYFNTGMISYYGYDCLDTAGTNIVGPKVTKLSNGNYLFYNRYGDSIPIYMDRDEGEEWVCYMDSNITVNAIVESISSSSFGGNGEITHQIRFNVEDYDQTSLHETVDDMVIKIGEKSGVLKTLAWVIFPYHGVLGFYPQERLADEEFIDDTYPSFDDIVNVSVAEIYDFHVGDEFHIEKFSWDETPFIVDKTLLKYKTINRVEDSTSVTIKFRREKQTGVDSTVIDDGGNDTTYYLYGHITIDTITRIMSKKAFSVTRPLYYTDYSSNTLFKKHNRPAYLQSSIPLLPGWNDSCATWDELYYYDEYYYIKGLGGPYYEIMDNFYRIISAKKYLKYYSLADGSTYGNPIQFVGLDRISHYATLHVFPNPATHKLILKMSNHQVNQYKIIDINGKAVLQGNIPANQSQKAIHIGSLPKGIYLIVIQKDGRFVAKKRFVKK